MSAYLTIAAMLPADLPLADRERRVSTASALFRQAFFTLEMHGMPADAVMAVAKHVLDSEAVARASQANR